MLLKRLYTSTELEKCKNEESDFNSDQNGEWRCTWCFLMPWRSPCHEREGKDGGTVPHCAVLVKRALNWMSHKCVPLLCLDISCACPVSIKTCVSTSATATSLPEGVSTKKISSHIRMPVVSLSMPPLSAFHWWPMPSWENQNQSCLQQDGSRLVTGKHHFVYNCTLNRQWQSLYPSDNRQEADLKI